MIPTTLNKLMLMSSLAGSSAHGPLGANGASVPSRVSHLRTGNSPLLGVAMGQFMLILAAAWN